MCQSARDPKNLVESLASCMNPVKGLEPKAMSPASPILRICTRKSGEEARKSVQAGWMCHVPAGWAVCTQTRKWPSGKYQSSSLKRTQPSSETSQAPPPRAAEFISGKVALPVSPEKSTACDLFLLVSFYATGNNSQVGLPRSEPCWPSSSGCPHQADQ